MQTKLISALFAGLFVAGAVVAQSTPTTPAAPAAKSAQGNAKFERHFGQTDKNGDDAISREEATGHPMLNKNFDAIDTNKDGKLSKEEMQATHQAMRDKHRQAMEARFKEADKDGDGALSRAEAETMMLAKVGAHFDRADANKDGKVTLEEMQSARQAMRGKMHGHMHEHAKKGDKDGKGRHHARMEEKFKAADKDGDGAVSRQEAEAASREHLAKKFERKDANKDGKLTMEEMRSGKHHRHMRSAA